MGFLFSDCKESKETNYQIICFELFLNFKDGLTLSIRCSDWAPGSCNQIFRKQKRACISIGLSGLLYGFGLLRNVQGKMHFPFSEWDVSYLQQGLDRYDTWEVPVWESPRVLYLTMETFVHCIFYNVHIKQVGVKQHLTLGSSFQQRQCVEDSRTP